MGSSFSYSGVPGEGGRTLTLDKHVSLYLITTDQCHLPLLRRSSTHLWLDVFILNQALARGVSWTALWSLVWVDSPHITVTLNLLHTTAHSHANQTVLANNYVVFPYTCLWTLFMLLLTREWAIVVKKIGNALIICLCSRPGLGDRLGFLGNSRHSSSTTRRTTRMHVWQVVDQKNWTECHVLFTERLYRWRDFICMYLVAVNTCSSIQGLCSLHLKY